MMLKTLALAAALLVGGGCSHAQRVAAPNAQPARLQPDDADRMCADPTFATTAIASGNAGTAQGLAAAGCATPYSAAPIRRGDAR